MKLHHTRAETWEEIAVGTAIILVVAWFIAKSAQTLATVATPKAPVSGNVQSFGQPYIWSGPYGGSYNAGLPRNASVAGRSPFNPGGQ